MKIEDLPGVYQLGDRLFTAETWEALYRTWDEYEVVERFLVDGDYCFVAETGRTTVGFVMGSVIHKRHSAWSYGYMMWIGVARGLKNRGVGKRLLEKLSEAFREDGIRIVIADTAKDNANAIRFFRKNGFEEASEHVFFSRTIRKNRRKRRAAA